MINYYFCSMTISANCKINIGLDVLERREDGYHELSTVMIPIRGLFDTLEVSKIEAAQTQFEGRGIMVDCPAEDNLCIKAYNLMRERYPAIGVIKIVLDKRVPFGAGLGGGSSDATAVILAINSLFELNLSEEELIDLASELGSDTAFFVRNSPQLCSSRGEVMTPIDLDLSGKYILLVKPDVNVSTGQAYAGVHPAYPPVPLSKLISMPLEEWQGKIKNDFEDHIFRSHPILGRIKEDILSCGALYAAMSGSGSTIYGIFDDMEKAKSEQLNCYSPYIFEL